jgi:hypothetical protein
LADAPVSAVRPFGADKTHARVTVGGVAAVGFGIAHALESRGLAAGSRISALVEIERARWAGREEIRLRIRELV